MISLRIRGRVSEAETGLGIGGLYVKAYDDDLLIDDLLGHAVTDGRGRFEIVVEREDFKELFEKRPDLYFKVLASDKERLIHRTPTACSLKGGRLDDVEIRIPRQKVGESAPAQRFELLGGTGDRPRDDFDPGEPLTVAATGLRPVATHEAVVRDDTGRELFTDRLISDADGRIEPTVVYPQIGLDDPDGGPPLPVEKAREKWAGRALTVELRDGERVVATARVRIANVFDRPLILSTALDGSPLNGFEAGRSDAVISLYSLPRGHERVRVYMVPRQHDWHLGDPLRAVTLDGGRAAVEELELAAGARDTRVVIAKAQELRPGAYDFVVRPLRYGYEDDQPYLRASDLVGQRRITGLVVREAFMPSKAVRGGCVNTLEIAGRSISGAPYLQFSNTFQVGENIYGALDPAALDPALSSKMVALYVVPHKTAAQWTASSALDHLAVLGGNPNVTKFLTQSFCVNANKRLLWPSASQVGEYDVVAEFGNNAGNAAGFVSDASFDTPLDIIDGYFVPGFRVVQDPGVETQFAHAGTFQYTEATQGTVTVTGDFGMNVTVNVRAVVHFPAEIAGATTVAQVSNARPSYPLVIVAHGNSSATNSYQGYDYLLAHLARNGFIVASIHMNPGMFALDRARVLLHHIAVMKTMFGAKVANNVGLMGHSRGGEAVIVAARLNQQEALGHGINAVISLAPTDWISSPTLGGAWAKPYLVVYGSMDGDVAGPDDTGFELYDRANGRKKSMVFVYGATHGRFNTIWGDTDLGFGQIGATDHARLVNADAHQKIARAYMTAFFRQHMENEPQWEGMFKGEWVPASVQAADGGKVKLYVQYEDDDHRPIDTFEGAHVATSWQASTIGGAVAQSGLPAVPLETQLASADAHSPHDTGGLMLRWDSLGDSLRFDVPVGQRDVSAFAAVSFRIAQRVDSADNPAGLPQDLRLVLHDTGGKTRAVRVSKFGAVPAPHTRHFNVFTKSSLSTIRIPLTAFTIRCAGVEEVDLTAVERVTLEFSEKPTGEVAIDSVEFTQ